MECPADARGCILLACAVVRWYAFPSVAAQDQMHPSGTVVNVRELENAADDRYWASASPLFDTFGHGSCSAR
jgi:hypothetical protein